MGKYSRINEIRTCVVCGEEFLADREFRIACSRRCSLVKATRGCTKESREKARLALIQTNKTRVNTNCGKSWAVKIGERVRTRKTDQISNVWQLSNRTRCKVIRRLDLSCAVWGWNSDICDIHHLMPKSFVFRDEHKYLAYLCPNCHRLAHAGKLQLKNITTLDKQIGDSWRKVCYS